jgi:hypothetical protein
MNDELKKAIERLRYFESVRYEPTNSICADILAVCDCAEKAMRVVEAAGKLLIAVEGSDKHIGLLSMRESYYCVENCAYTDEREAVRKALAAMEEP